MNKSTHLAAGVAFAVMASCPAPATILVCVGSLLPDIDTSNSTFGKKVKFIAFFFKHRTFTHSLLFAALTTLINPYLGLGVLSHIFMDMFNPQGVELLFPFGRKLSFPLISKVFVTGSAAEDFMRAILYIVIGVYVTIMILSSGDNQFDQMKESLLQIKENFIYIINVFKAWFSM